MSDSKTEEFAILEDRLKQLMRPVFMGETWIHDHYQKPTLTPLQNAYKNFQGEPHKVHFELFQHALISCKTAANTKISDNNMPDIIQVAEKMLDSLPSITNTKNSPR